MLSISGKGYAKSIDIQVQRDVSSSRYYIATWEAEENYRMSFHPKTLEGNDTGGTKITKSYPAESWVFKRSCNKTHRIDIYWIPRSDFAKEENRIKTLIIDKCEISVEDNPNYVGPTPNPNPNPNPNPEPNPSEPEPEPEQPVVEISVVSAQYNPEFKDITIEWSQVFRANRYRVFQNGVFLRETSGNTTEVEPNAEVLIEALDERGNVIGRSNIYRTDFIDDNLDDEGLGHIENFEVYDGFLAWDSYPNASYYVINGQMTPNNYLSFAEGELDGDVTVIAYNQAGQPIAQATTNACFTQLCNCIRELIPVLDAIDSNTGYMISQLSNLVGISDQIRSIASQIRNDTSSIVSNTSQIVSNTNQIANNTRGILDELQTFRNYTAPSVSDYSFPTIEQNKPPMRETKFEDTNTYFRDQGDDSAPPPLPTAPEPTDQWNDGKGGIVRKQAPMKPNEVLKKAPSLTKDSVLTKDSILQKDRVLDKSPSLKRDAPMKKQVEQGTFIWTAEQYREREGKK